MAARSKKIKKIALMVHPGKTDIDAVATRLIKLANKQGVKVEGVRLPGKSWYAPCREMLDRLGIPPAKLDKQNPVDLLMVIGGDGTLLSAARLAHPTKTPIVGINMGSLGFLTEISTGELNKELQPLFKGDYTLESRLMLKIKVITAEGKTRRYVAMNDIVLYQDAVGRIGSYSLQVDGEPVMEVQADGMIAATPTGSTAYSLSAGGPVISPKVSAMLVTPICPHSLTTRSLVVSAHCQVRLALLETDHGSVMSIDGQETYNLSFSDHVLVNAEPSGARFVRMHKNSFFNTLKTKFHLGKTPG